jgi:hypothetical protein
MDENPVVFCMKTIFVIVDKISVNNSGAKTPLVHRKGYNGESPSMNISSF